MISIVILGSACSGKKALIDALAGKVFTVKNSPSIFGWIETRIALTLEKQLYDLKIRALSAEERFKTIANSLKKEASLGLYCVDLSDAALTEKMIANAKADFDENGKLGSAFILVGTKSDIATEENRQKFESMQGFVKIMISAKEAHHIDVLKTLIAENIAKACNQQPINQVLHEKDAYNHNEVGSSFFLEVLSHPVTKGFATVILAAGLMGLLIGGAGLFGAGALVIGASCGAIGLGLSVGFFSSRAKNETITDEQLAVEFSQGRS